MICADSSAAKRKREVESSRSQCDKKKSRKEVFVSNRNRRLKLASLRHFRSRVASASFARGKGRKKVVDLCLHRESRRKDTGQRTREDKAQDGVSAREVLGATGESDEHHFQKRGGFQFF